MELDVASEIDALDKRVTDLEQHLESGGAQIIEEILAVTHHLSPALTNLWNKLHGVKNEAEK